MEQETYSALPIEMGAYGSADQRRATDFAYLMPGVQGNETNGNATTNTGVINGSGSRGAASMCTSTAFLSSAPAATATRAMCGPPFPSMRSTSSSADLGYWAMYEGQGVMNYSIKQGTSRLHGSVYEFFRNTALDTWGWFGKVPNSSNPCQ